MASSQNEQDNRRYAVAAGIPLFEPADSQEAYDFLFQAIEVSERWSIPVLFRMTTRVCHSKTIVNAHMPPLKPADVHFERNIRERVMIPAYARPAHRKLRKKLMEIAEWNETSSLNQVYGNGSSLGMITSGVVFNHDGGRAGCGYFSRDDLPSAGCQNQEFCPEGRALLRGGGGRSLFI